MKSLLIKAVFFILLGFFLVLNSPQEANAYEGTRRSPQEIINHINEKVDNLSKLKEEGQLYPPNRGTWESFSFGRYLWGLAGCESTWGRDENAYNGASGYLGLYQFAQSTWESVNSKMGKQPPGILDDYAQVDAVIWMLTNDYPGGYNHWPACNDSDPDNGDWILTTEGSVNAGIPGWPPPPQGDIIVTPNIRFEQAPNIEIWLSGQTPQPASVVNSTVFSGLSPGMYQVYLRASGPGIDSNYSIESSVYTLCDSSQDGCVRSQCNPLHGSCPLAFTEEAYGKYHVWDAQRWVNSVSQHEIVVDVNVPSQGFVDLMIYLCPSDVGKKSCYPYGYFGKNNASQPVAMGDSTPLSIFVKDAYAAERSPLPPPRLFDYSVINLPFCSNTTYGGSSDDDPSNITTRFTVYNAIKVEYEAYANGNLYYNSLRDEGQWQNLNTASAYSLSVDNWNLSPDVMYSWRVRSGNETQWSPWVSGNPWTVLACNSPPPPLAPPQPTNLQRTLPPGCSDGLYNVPFTWSISGDVTKTQLRRNGSIIGDWNQAVTGATITNFSPGTNYTWDVQTGNDSGWSGWASGEGFNVGYCNPPPTQPPNLREVQRCNSGDAQKPDVNFQWDAVAGMTNYAVYIWDPGGVIPAVWRNGGWAVQGLTGGTNYDFLDLPNYTGLTWGVESYNSRGSSGVSQWRGITTKNCVPPTLNNLRLENEPGCSDGSYGTAADPFRIRFDVTNADKVELEIYVNGVRWINSITNNGVWIGGMSPGYTYTLGYNLQGLSNETTYTWRVRAENSVGWTNWDGGAGDGPWWNVHRCKPLAPVNLVAIRPDCSDGPYTVKFTWKSPGWGPSPTKTEFKIGSGGAVTTWNFAYYGPRSVSGFQPSTGYDWYVRFGNNYGWSDWANSWWPSNAVPGCTLPDLTINSLTTDKSGYASGETVNVTIQIKNIDGGAATKNGFFVAYANEPKNLAKLIDCSLVISEVNTWWTESASLGAGATKTYNHSFTAPSTAGAYKIRAAVDWGCLNQEADDTLDPQTMGANNSKDITFTVATLPTNPANLTAVLSCSASNQPVINFSWTDSLYESGYWLDVHTQQWTGDTTPAGWGYKELPANSTSFAWSAANPLSGNVTYPLPSKTYWWRLQAFSGAGSSPHVYPPNTTNPQGGGAFPTFDCKPDLQIFMVIPDGVPGEIVAAKVYPVNVGTGSTYPSAKINVGADSDFDGFSDSDEAYFGTNPNSRCSATGASDDEAPPDAWPVDLNDDGKVDSAELALITAAYGTTNPRYDLNRSGGSIDMSDINVFRDYYNKNCRGTFEVAVNMDKETLHDPANPQSMDCTDPKDAVVILGPLGPGEALFEETVSVALPAPGSYTATALVDSAGSSLPCGVVSESFENNNTATDAYDLDGFDLSASFVGGSWDRQVYSPGETAAATVRITNVPPATKTPPTFLGIWPGHAGEPALPKCEEDPQEPSDPPATGDSQPVGELIAGFSAEIPISFNVGSIPGTFIANGYVMYDCSGDDYNWDNNLTGGAVGSINFTYTVVTGTWFETTGGDVGSSGSGNPSISVSQAPPTTPVARYQSDYLLTGLNLDSKVVSKRWRINNYGKPLMLGTPYAYMAERFRQTPDMGSKICQISAGWTQGYHYCNETEAAFNSGNGPNGTSIFFIDGNFTVKNNLTLDSRYSAIFIVKGNITVETDVTRIDGIYIAGGTFHSTDPSGNVGAQLVVNGAIYAANVNLNRALGGSLCPSGDQCDNQKTAAEKIVYDPKYLIALNSLLGSPGVSWKEVAP